MKQEKEKENIEVENYTGAYYTVLYFERDEVKEGGR